MRVLRFCFAVAVVGTIGCGGPDPLPGGSGTLKPGDVGAIDVWSVPTDGEVIDRIGPEVSTSDAPAPDASTADVLMPDASMGDAIAPDASTDDASLADASVDQVGAADVFEAGLDRPDAVTPVDVAPDRVDGGASDVPVGRPDSTVDVVIDVPVDRLDATVDVVIDVPVDRPDVTVDAPVDRPDSTVDGGASDVPVDRPDSTVDVFVDRPDATVDAPVDRPDATVDVVIDAPVDRPDVTVDTGLDASVDRPDVTVDTGLDVPADRPDVPIDAVVDTGLDVPVDRPDVTVDAAVDRPDTTVDAVVDTGLDVPVDRIDAAVDAPVDRPDITLADALDSTADGGSTSPPDPVAYVGTFSTRTDGRSFLLPVRVNGNRRDVWLQMPTTLGPNPALMLAFHGTNGDGAGMLAESGASTVIASNNVIFIAPTSRWFGDEGADFDHSGGNGTYWETANNPNPDTNEDLLLTRAIIQEARRAFNIDPARVYAYGHSNGGFMAYMVAQVLRDRVVGFGENSAGLSRCYPQQACRFQGSGTTCAALSTQSGWCTCSGAELPVPVPTTGRHTPGILMHGTADNLVSVFHTCTLESLMRARGNPVSIMLFDGGGHYLSVNTAPRVWAYLSAFRMP